MSLKKIFLSILFLSLASLTPFIHGEDSKKETLFSFFKKKPESSVEKSNAATQNKKVSHLLQSRWKKKQNTRNSLQKESIIITAEQSEQNKDKMGSLLKNPSVRSIRIQINNI